jgi:nitrogen regulatory protein P-II 2
MKTALLKRVTIIGDDTVQYRILEELDRLGALGYTWYAVHGKGHHGVRPRHGEPGNTKIEAIATPEVANRILEYVAEHYLANYAMIAFLDDVEVLPGENGARFREQPEVQA